jgi:hypothetical protein
MRMKNTTIRVLTVASGAALLLAASSASALEVKTGSDKVDVKLYGQIDRAVMYADDGDDSKFFHVDNNNSSTRIGVKGEVKATDALTVGSNLELEWKANSSDKVSMDEETTMVNLQIAWLRSILPARMPVHCPLVKAKWLLRTLQRLICLEQIWQVCLESTR